MICDLDDSIEIKEDNKFSLGLNKPEFRLEEAFPNFIFIAEKYANSSIVNFNKQEGDSKN